MSLIDRGKTMEEIPIDVCDGFEVTDIIEKIPEVKAIPIPDNETNGDKIIAMFPNCEQKEHMNNGYFEMYFDNDLKNASYMRVSKDWWNAPFKRGREE